MLGAINFIVVVEVVVNSIRRNGKGDKTIRAQLNLLLLLLLLLRLLLLLLDLLFAVVVLKVRCSETAISCRIAS